jgi:ATP-dependent RNA helicase DDX55/SPB4
MEMLLKSPCKTKQSIGAIIVSPTRELTTQIADVFKVFSEKAPGHASLLLLTGGTDPQKDINSIKENGCNIIVATPGRLWDLFRYCHTSRVAVHSNCCRIHPVHLFSPHCRRLPEMSTYARSLEVLVLDEADRLLDMGFKEKLGEILSRLPKQRRTVCAKQLCNCIFVFATL